MPSRSDDQLGLGQSRLAGGRKAIRACRPDAHNRQPRLLPKLRMYRRLKKSPIRSKWSLLLRNQQVMRLRVPGLSLFAGLVTHLMKGVTASDLPLLALPAERQAAERGLIIPMR